MCGRFVLTANIQLLAKVFGLDLAGKIVKRRYNVAPTQDVAVVPNVTPRALEFHRWGLIPSWAKDPAIGNRMINARAETLAEKPSFRTALRKRRCLVLADGFFEWRRDGASKTPMLITLRSGLPFAFAGLWEHWRPPEGDEIKSCTIITTAADEFMSPIHDRMPVILGEKAWDAWLDPEPREPKDLLPLLASRPGDGLKAVAVSKLVNSPRNDTPACIEPVG